MPRKMSADTLLIIEAIKTSSRELAAHTSHDDERFDAINATLAEVASDVKSLLKSREFSRGMIKTATIAGGSAGAIIPAIIAIVRYFAR